ncbi:MAG: hypothetical protein ACT4O1_08875 [Gemmatimonadota bacterium]
MFKVALSVSTLLLAATSAGAQLISIRTVPVSQAHQFEIFPSRTVAMGGVGIAVADPLLDPFSNPAKGASIGATRFFGSPATYSVTSGAGGGRTLPVGALARSETWYGGLWLALQEIDLSEQQNFFGPIPFACPACESTVDLTNRDRTKGNSYAFVMAGRQLSRGVSVGGSVLWSRLSAVDGVDLLYAGSAKIDQLGNSLDLRLGLTRQFAGDRSLEAIVLHNRFGSEHDVFYLDGFWDPVTQQFSQTLRLEKNLDRTRVWGLHLGYEQPLSSEGWRAGGVFTVNRMDHPKIPNYAIMNIPRDPGNSSAFNIGFGLARTRANTTFGVDLIFEPIWSHTWADAADATENRLGQPIPAGGMTIENRFRFTNTIARMGLEQGFTVGETGPLAALQLGLSLRNTHYTLDQHDHIQISDRQHRESWTEWTPTWGLSLNFPELEIRYLGSVTKGTGRPGIANFGGRFMVADAAAAPGTHILAAPSGPLTLDEVTVRTHQISIALPIR